MRYIAFALIGGLILSAQPAFATSSNTSGRSSSNVPLARTSFDNSVETADTLRERERDRLADLSRDGIPNPFDGESGAPLSQAIKDTNLPKDDLEKKKNVKQVYNPPANLSMRRTITDPRIDDGYVQGLLRQAHPHTN